MDSFSYSFHYATINCSSNLLPSTLRLAEHDERLKQVTVDVTLAT